MPEPLISTGTSVAADAWTIVVTWGLPAAWVIGGVFLGLVIERIILARLKVWSGSAGGGYHSAIIAGVKGVAFFWCLMLGIYLALSALVLSTEVHAMAGKALMVALMFSLTVALARVAAGVVMQHAKRSGGAVASSIITNLLVVLIYLMGFLVILDSLGVQVTPILTALGVGGLAVALALKDTLENLFAGLQLIAAKKIHLGDFVRLDTGDEGVVRDLTWRYTTIQTLPGNMIIVPNAKLSMAIVTNFSDPSPTQPVAVPVGVAYGSDLERVERVAIEVARQVQTDVVGGVRDFQPFVRFTAFADSSVNFNVIMRAASFQDQFVLRHELIKRLHERFQSDGIEIPFPIRTLQIKGSLPAAT